MIFKNLPKGSTIYLLVKNDELKYIEGTLNSVSAPRMEMNPNQFPSSRTVIDMTFTVEGKTYTEAVDEQACMVESKQVGGVNLLAADKDSILQELKLTLKNSEEYLKSVETEVPKQQNRVEQCKELIASLDTEYAEKKAFDSRITKLEESAQETNAILKQILNKLDK